VIENCLIATSTYSALPRNQFALHYLRTPSATRVLIKYSL
jgi:hypothetical protein